MNPKQVIFTPQAIQKVLPRILKPALDKRGFSLAAVILDWPKIVGENIARHCVPQKISFGRTKSYGAILHVKATSGASLWLQHSEHWLIEKINSYFGYKSIERLKIIQGPLPFSQESSVVTRSPAPLNADQERDLLHLKETISDDELVIALQNLGRSLYGEINKIKPKE